MGWVGEKGAPLPVSELTVVFSLGREDPIAVWALPEPSAGELADLLRSGTAGAFIGARGFTLVFPPIGVLVRRELPRAVLALALIGSGLKGGLIFWLF
jgi:hypothetical protein